MQKARDELARGENRQAAEKGWLAIVTAGRAMLRSAGSEWASSRGVADRVEEVEAVPRPVTGAIRIVASTLHGTCFYGGALGEEFCGRQAIEANFGLVDAAIDHVATFCRTHRGIPGRRRYGKR